MPESPVPSRRRLLPFLPGHSGGSRDAMTCQYRCGNQCDHEIPNRSDNPYLGDVITDGLSRRGLLQAGAAAAVAMTFVGVDGSHSEAATATAADSADRPGRVDVSGSALTFAAVPPNKLDTVVVPNGYDWSPLIAWGEPILQRAPTFDIDKQTPQAQAGQFGYNCDFVAVMPLRGRSNSALLVVNHEYTNEELMFRGWSSATGSTREQTLIAMAAHGMSVVLIERVGRTGEWKLSSNLGQYNRRITAATPMRLSGPAAGHPLLRTSTDRTGTKVLGTLNNCAGGVTPWGTVLSGEENVNQYFGASADLTDPATVAALRRYGIATTTTATPRRFEAVDKRFDLAQEPNEANRFGWIVEVDPYNRFTTPVKRTALGRFKHEGATIHLAADGRAVAYMGDDERHDYLYKFVSEKAMKPGNSSTASKHNMTLLDSGDLYVAKLTGDSPAAEIDGSGALPTDGGFDGTGEWLPLVVDGESKVPGFTVAEVLIHTRLAADLVGPTKMDRPEDVEANPTTGKVYVALTNNTDRGKAVAKPSDRFAPADEANPRNANRHGQVLELVEAGGDAAATTFTWSLFLVAGDPALDTSTYFAGYDKTKVSPISCPDNVAFDPAGNLWIATDGNALGANDGMFAVALEGPDKGHLKQFASVPNGAECCGPTLTGDGRTALIAVQHPGELTGASVDNPLSTFPYGDGPRPTVCTIWRRTPGNKRIGV